MPPAEDRITELTHAGLTFDVRDTGPIDGEPIVLLHGFPQRASSWDHVAARLHEAGHRTIAPDQRGYSPRARPGRRRDYGLHHLAADAEALLDRIGRPAHLVGHDWGSAVAWLVAGSHPAVRSLTSISVPHPGAYLRSMAGSQVLRSWYVTAFNLPFLPELFATRTPRRFAAQLRAFGMTDDDTAWVAREIVEYGALPGALAWYRAIPLSVTRGTEQWTRTVAVPVTHVWSTGDTALGRSTADLAHQWATGPFELVVLEGSHWLPEQQPDRIAEIVLDRVRSVG